MRNYTCRNRDKKCYCKFHACGVLLCRCEVAYHICQDSDSRSIAKSNRSISFQEGDWHATGTRSLCNTRRYVVMVMAKAGWLCRANSCIAKTPDAGGIGGFLFRIFREFGLELQVSFLVIEGYADASTIKLDCIEFCIRFLWQISL